MGVSISHGCWNGPCSSFNDFRRQFAKAVGIDLDKMEGYNMHWDENSLNFIIHDDFIKWEDIPKDDIHILLDHSDCDGIIEHKDLIPLATRMGEILPMIQNDYYRAKGKKFIDGLYKAHHEGENIEFR